MSTAPARAKPRAGDVRQPRLGPLGWGRWVWRNLTSMRTALFLLLLLAVAAVPGSVFPQRNIDAGKVTRYLAAHRGSGPWMDRLGFFDVYASPWFSAIYLLLFISLIGCILPRTRVHLRALTSRPPKPPRRLDRLPAHTHIVTAVSAEQALGAARQALRGRPGRLGKSRGRFRVHGHDPATLSAESGYLRETGNLAFHIGLCLVIVGVAIGHLWSWRADVIVPEGSGFSTALGSLDTFSAGPLVNPADLPSFNLNVTKMNVTFEDKVGGSQFGKPRKFLADTTVDTGTGRPHPAQIAVNSPLRIGDAEVFLLGNGYAPVLTVRDAKGAVVYQDATPFLPQDGNYLSTGVVKVTTAAPQELGLDGLFLPTADQNFTRGPTSLFPGLRNPVLVASVWTGNLFPGNAPQSVYTLDTSQMKRLTKPGGAPLLIRLAPGQTVQLPDGRGSISFDRTVRWAGLSVRHTPGKTLTLLAALAAAAGLITSLLVKRRRVFIRVTPDPSAGDKPGAVVTIGALAKGTDPTLTAVVHELADHIARLTSQAPPDRRPR
ncbi:cytochrome c biogenesis protein ResB [Flexivirga sp. ID2601S]|uniref:Cytochrome c biogenesis protein ResB n=1 Tax=Flexivirga aerilata TaxID=1656889 RepID=A0A849ALS8_9MICO|nr:cytochrome c biogenesis protein ResB [Flexivirga aerilata]NNG40737.1 cytochrome c biogenesis protein ResB [Flexivirga aerilata]